MLIDVIEKGNVFPKLCVDMKTEEDEEGIWEMIMPGSASPKPSGNGDDSKKAPQNSKASAGVYAPQLHTLTHISCRNRTTGQVFYPEARVQYNHTTTATFQIGHSFAETSPLGGGWGAIAMGAIDSAE